MSRHRLPARRTLDLASVETARADLHLLDLAVDDRANHLEVRLPGATGLVVRVRDIVAERNAFVAHVAAVSLNAHGSALDELDARHLGAVTFAVTGFENARIAARTARELRSELLEELVRRFALVDMTRSEATRVQRAGARLRDQLLDERTQLFRLGFGRLDRAMLDERRREIAHERELLLGGPAKLPPRFAMPHVPYSSMSSGAAAAARLGGVPQSSTRTLPSPPSSKLIPKFHPSRSSRSAIS